MTILKTVCEIHTYQFHELIIIYLCIAKEAP